MDDPLQHRFQPDDNNNNHNHNLPAPPPLPLPQPQPPLTSQSPQRATPDKSLIPHSSAQSSTSARAPFNTETPDAITTDALAGTSPPFPPPTSMEPEPSGHRRRRSSVKNALDGSSLERRNRSSRSPTKRDELPEEPKPVDGLVDDDTKSTSEELELNDFSDEGLEDDEETGLTGQDRERRKKRRRRNTLLDQRIVGDVQITTEEKEEADRHVFKSGLINGLLIGLWYIFSLSISIYNKWMFSPDHLNFQFPLFTTCAHMLVQFSLSSLVLYVLPRFRPRHDSISNPDNAPGTDLDLSHHETESKKPLMSRMFYLTRLGPCGAATGLDIGLGNASLKFITLTFYTMCKSSSLAFVLFFAFLFRLEAPSWRLVAIIATMTAGVVMMVAGEVDFSAIGFLLVISAAFFSGFRWGLTQILLLRNPATSNPFSSIFYLAPIMFASLVILAIPIEGFPALLKGIKLLVADKGPILGPCVLIFPGTIAFCMTASEFALLQRTSVVTLSIAGIFKEVVTISAAAIVFGDTLTPINISGLFVTIGAIAAYNYIKITKMREDAQLEARKQRLADHGASSGSEADGESEESDAEDWNTMDGAMVTADGDIIPSPRPFKIRQVESSTSDGHVGSAAERS